MKTHRSAQLPLSTYGAAKRAVRTQFAALCWRRRPSDPTRLQVLLVTSRGTRRWIVPKGWPMDGKTPAGSAAVEAWEEAGVRGHAVDRCLGIYSYAKEIDGADDLPVMVALYPIEVTDLSMDWPEKAERKRRWMGLSRAARKVAEPELGALIRSFDPALLG